MKERQEYAEAETPAERLEEKADQLYYLIKEIFNLADSEFSLDEIYIACVTKYKLRFIMNQCHKDKKAERLAMMEAINR